MNRLSRRAFVRLLAGLSASAVGLTVATACGLFLSAAQAPRVARVGYLTSNPSDIPGGRDAFLAGLHDTGWVDGQNLAMEYRWSENHLERYPVLAAELVALKLDVIVTSQIFGVRALVQESTSVPIVIANVNDPLGNGLIASLARPGGNVTGTTQTVVGGFGVKKFELLREIVPDLARVAVVFEPGNPAAQNDLHAIESAALSAGVEVQAVPITSPDEVDGALSASLVRRPEALILGGASAITTGHRLDVIAFANSHRLPSIGASLWAKDGGLLGYGPAAPPLYRRAAYYVDRILRGANPADLPVEQPTVFDLGVNLTTARALGLTIPPSLALQVTEWFQ